MDVPATDVEFTQVEFGSITVAAVVVAVMLGPGAVTIVGVDSLWVTALSVALMGALAFVVAAVTLNAIKRL